MTMPRSAAVLLGLLALPHALGYTNLGEGRFNPDLIHRHVYDLSEYCPADARVMYFGDEVLVTSQRPWQPVYPGNVLCNMNFTVSEPDHGILVSVIKADTPDCGDYLRVARSDKNDPEEEMFCGHRANMTGKTEIYMNETVSLTWKAIVRDTQKPSEGIQVLLTGCQRECKIRQSCFECGNGLFIDQVHMCNGFNNCGDNSDERGCPFNNPVIEKQIYVPTGVTELIVAIFAASSVFVLLCVACVIIYKLYTENKTLKVEVTAEREARQPLNMENMEGSAAV